ncbi:hypothetical protein BH11PSE9_BH11PSE9_29720 [soil metagenome]
MKLTRLAAALAVATASFGAQATDYSFDAHDPYEASFLIPFAGVVSGGLFSDKYAFALVDTEMVSSTVVSNNLSPFFSITQGSYSIFDFASSSTVASFAYDGATGSTSHSVTLGPGLYAYVVGGVTGPAGYYSLTSTITPVPEPTTLAMLFAGLGVIGFLIKRRQG